MESSPFVIPSCFLNHLHYCQYLHSGVSWALHTQFLTLYFQADLLIQRPLPPAKQSMLCLLLHLQVSPPETHLSPCNLPPSHPFMLSTLNPRGLSYQQPLESGCFSLILLSITITRLNTHNLLTEIPDSPLFSIQEESFRRETIMAPFSSPQYLEAPSCLQSHLSLLPPWLACCPLAPAAFSLLFPLFPRFPGSNFRPICHSLLLFAGFLSTHTTESSISF